jgi:ankyrin repeat protein
VIETRSIAGCVALLLLSAGGASGSDSRVADAVRDGNRAALRSLIAQKADVNAPQVDGTTALHWAVRSDELATVSQLIRAGAKANAANRYGVTPLTLAAGTGSLAVLEALLKAGADARVTGPEGETALMIAARTGRVEVVRLLLARGADVHAKERWYGQTALMWAAAENHAAVVKALIDAGATLNARANVLEAPKREISDFRTDKNGAALQTLLTTFPKGGLTPLLFAARQGSSDAVRVLADAGADLNLGDPDGITPMVLAIRNGFYDTAAALVEKGANVNAADAAGRTPLYMAVDMHSLDWIQNRPAPQSTGTLDSLDLVKLLLERGADPNPLLKSAPPGWKGDAVAAQNTFGGAVGAGATPFIRAAKNADHAAMRLLLEKGADPGLATRSRVTALMALVGGLGRKYGADLHVSPDEEKQALEAITLLLARGADVNAANDAGLTALHAAAMVGANGVVRFLVDRGARLDAKSSQGRTPRDEALRGMANVDGALNDPHLDTAALLEDLMEKRGLTVSPVKPAAAGP